MNPVMETLAYFLPSGCSSWLGNAAVLERTLILIPLFPLLGFLFNAVFGRRMSKSGPGVVASLAAGLSLVWGAFVVAALGSGGGEIRPLHVVYADWINFGVLNCSFGFMVDRLTAVMLMVVGGVGTLIHIYSIGYIAHDRSPARFFSYLNLFLFSMYLLILGDNLVLLFVGWEGVGLCSYLLIGFWYEHMPNAEAGQKAFVVNRIGDAGFILGIFTLLALFGTVNFTTSPGGAAARPGLAEYAAQIAPPAKKHHETAAELKGTKQGGGAATEKAEAKTYAVALDENLATAAVKLSVPDSFAARLFSGWTLGAMLTLACLLLFVGAVGKSAQIPLFVWLPDAMAGPTPVSALIHAATMVTAGVYMVARLHMLFSLSPAALTVVAVVGALTALLAALIALTQNDIKKVLAYSTVSQLGYMFIGLGVGAFSVAVFHVVTHAFFKGLLFLCAGAVIHALHDEQDMRRMGGLFKRLPITALTMLAGSLSLAGVWGLAGWFSKDNILNYALASAEDGGGVLGMLVYLCGLAAAVCTAFYILRLWLLTFTGEERTPRRTMEHLHKPGLTMTVPLVILALLSLVGGVWLQGWFLGTTGPGTLGLHNLRAAGDESLEHAHHLNLFATGAATVAGLLAAFVVFSLKKARPPEDGVPEFILVRLSRRRFYVDEIYDALVVFPLKIGAEILHWLLETVLVDGLIVGSARGVRALGGWLRTVQSGLINAYAFFMLLGAAAMLFFLWGAL